MKPRASNTIFLLCIVTFWFSFFNECRILWKVVSFSKNISGHTHLNAWPCLYWGETDCFGCCLIDFLLYKFCAGRLRRTVNSWKLSTLWITAFSWVCIIVLLNTFGLWCPTIEAQGQMDWECSQRKVAPYLMFYIILLICFSPYDLHC